MRQRLALIRRMQSQIQNSRYAWRMPFTVRHRSNLETSASKNRRQRLQRRKSSTTTIQIGCGSDEIADAPAFVCFAEFDQRQADATWLVQHGARQLVLSAAVGVPGRAVHPPLGGVRRGLGG